VLRVIESESGGNRRARSSRKTTTHGLCKTFQAGKRSGVALPGYAGQAIDVQGIGGQAGFFAQSSALIAYLLTLNL